MDANELNERRLARQYISVQRDRKVLPVTWAGPCCDIVSEPSMTNHQNGIYHLALTNGVNLARLRQAVQRELAGDAADQAVKPRYTASRT